MSNPQIDVYAAGLVDGEGCIYISKSRGWHSLRMDMGMTVKARPLLEQMQATYGGTIRETREATDRWEAAICWSVFGSQAANFLARITSYLRLKSEQARLGLTFEQVRLSGWTPETKAQAEAIRLRIMELNRKGPSETQEERGLVPFAHLVGGTWMRAQTTLFGHSETYSGTWPRSGMTRSGTAYLLPPSVPLTSVIGSTSLPTPTTQEFEHPLMELESGRRLTGSGRTHSVVLADIVRFPTPTVAEGRNRSASSGAAIRPTLAMMARHGLWPTANRWDGLQSHGVNAVGGSLNPTWVELLMGFPPGWTDLDGAE